MSEARDTRPALGTPGGPSTWKRATDGAEVELARPRFGDADWSYLFHTRDTEYASAEPAPGQVAAANRRGRAAPAMQVHGPFIKAPVWTWEVPLYFWFGGMASGSSFVALACDAAGDERAAAVARKVALGAVAPAPLLLIADLGRPDRFLNMLRVFKPRSPMNMGAWCLVAFSSTAAGAVGADILGRPQLARALGLSTAALGGYLGSYTGVLLACTAVPAWARSRILLGPIFISTATATGAAATRLALAAEGLPDGHPTARALRTIETGSMLTELSLSAINERLLGQAAEALRERTPGLLFRAAKSLVLLGMSTRIFARRGRPWAHDLASVLYLAAGLAFRFAWVFGGRASAEHDEAVAAMARGRQAPDEETERPRERRAASVSRSPLPLPSARRAWGEGVRRASLAVGRLVRS